MQLKDALLTTYELAQENALDPYHLQDPELLSEARRQQRALNMVYEAYDLAQVRPHYPQENETMDKNDFLNAEQATLVVIQGGLVSEVHTKGETAVVVANLDDTALEPDTLQCFLDELPNNGFVQADPVDLDRLLEEAEECDLSATGEECDACAESVEED